MNNLWGPFVHRSVLVSLFQMIEPPLSDKTVTEQLKIIIFLTSLSLKWRRHWSGRNSTIPLVHLGAQPLIGQTTNQLEFWFIEFRGQMMLKWKMPSNTIFALVPFNNINRCAVLKFEKCVSLESTVQVATALEAGPGPKPNATLRLGVV